MNLRTRSTALLSAALVVAFAQNSAAQHAPGAASPSTKVWPRVPSWPPDSIPIATWKQIHLPENMEDSAPEWGARFPRNIVLVLFREETSRADKQQAIDAIRGTVVGGVAVRRGGYYYVRIPDDGTARPLFRAIAKLKSFPQVQSATPELPELQML